jgi:hypothetical protein
MQELDELDETQLEGKGYTSEELQQTTNTEGGCSIAEEYSYKEYFSLSNSSLPP